VSGLLGKGVSEQHECLLDRARKLGQSVTSEPSLPDRRLKDKIAVHVHVWVWPERSELEPDDVCIALYPPSIGDHAVSNGSGVSVRCKGEGFGTGDSGVAKEAERRMDDAMLVGVVEPVDDGEEVVVRVCPGLVRLRLLDDCSMVLGDPTEPPLLPPRKVGGGATDGVLGCFAVGVGVAQTRKLANEVVEGAAKIVGEVADEKAQERRRLPDYLDRKDILACVHPELGPDYVGLSFTGTPFVEGGRFGIEDAQVLVRSVELGERIV
jgi:hypothetical protein